MPLITITSDLGNKDHYLAVMKGRLLSQLESIQIIDVTHDISNYNIPEAAFILKNTYANFPINTIHLVMVGISDTETDFVIIKHKEQFFIGLDNGVFTLAFENEPIIAYKLNISPPPELFSFPDLSVLVQAASHLSRGGVPEVISEPIQNLRPVMNYAPVIQQDTIRATIQYIDSYGNVITNVTKELFTKIQMGRNVEIRFRVPGAMVTEISTQYSDVDGGDIIALFNSSGLLEIAINAGPAASLLGMKINETISINFV